MLIVLEQAGFTVVRSKGSHHYLRHRDDPSRRTVIAVHPGDIPEGTVRSILRQAKISREEFIKLVSR
jgi:predicted RNA binding protein YcfA (HicA-like mRNA interferase family)